MIRQCLYLVLCKLHFCTYFRMSFCPAPLWLSRVLPVKLRYIPCNFLPAQCFIPRVFYFLKLVFYFLRALSNFQFLYKTGLNKCLWSKINFFYGFSKFLVTENGLPFVRLDVCLSFFTISI